MMIARGVMEGGTINVSFNNGEFGFDVRKREAKNKTIRKRAGVA
jgi:hypothetical protein